jgi:toxoflavin synthase
MTTYYDPIAEQYQQIRSLLPVWQYVDEYTYFQLIGDVKGKSVLDLGCGYGFYSRKLKHLGAQKVVGVDISSQMIAIASASESQEPLGIEYIVADVCSLNILGSFDLVVASYLLNHAQTRETLLKMCQTISINLKPGGRFVGMNNNTEQLPSTYSRCSKYGLTKKISQPLQEGTIITVILTNPSSTEEITVQDYYINKDTFEWAFRLASFKEIRFYPSIVSDELIKKFGHEFWQDWLECQPLLGIECQKY